MDVNLRPARPDDHDAVVAFTERVWTDRDGDYIPHIYHDWIAGDGDTQRTLVADTGDEIAGIAQGVLLSDHESWGQGMRVNPDYRGEGIASALTHELFDWAHEGGATVMRNMVFSWNGAGLGSSRHSGYDPCTEFRWANPEPDADATPDLPVTDDANAAWRAWRDSAACEHLNGLAMDFEESWALSELTRENLERAREEGGLFCVAADGARAMAYRSRTYDRPGEDGEPVTWVEYGVGAWDDLGAARALFDAIRADAAARGDRTRVLIPETARHVSDVALLRVPFSEEPDFVMAADLTTDYRG